MIRVLVYLAVVLGLISGQPAAAQSGGPVVLQSAPERQPTGSRAPPPPPPLAAPAPPSGAAEAAARPTQDGGPVIPNYLRRSGSRAGGPANDLNPSGRPDGAPLPGGSVEDAVAGRDLYHGNYCGYGNRGNGLPPTDALDEACMHHDACYDRAGHRSCACDRVLEREAARVANSPRFSRELRARAGIVVQAGNVMECESP